MKRLINSLLIITLLSWHCAFSQSISPYNLNKEGSFSQMFKPDMHKNYYSNTFLQQTNTPENITNSLNPLFYIHLFGGTGLSILSSSKIESLLGDDFGIGIGLPNWSWGLIGGYKNIVQIEFNNGISDHDFNNNSIRPDIPSKVIKMDYETTDWQFKVNPLFWDMAGNSAYFIIIGVGDVEWRDKENDGFSGTSQIIGLEYAQFTKFVSWSFSFKRYGITFKKTILLNTPIDLKTEASDYILEMKIGFGYGI